MRKVSALPAAQGFPVQAVYLGGGTPTALRAEYLRDLLKTVAECFPLSNDCEITVEGRIHGFTPEKIEACLASGVNRFSIGVQSFDTDLRRSIGRISDEQEVRAGLERLAAYGQASIVADLIYGLPGQSLEDWERELDVLRETPLDGVDLYQLNIFPGGQLAKALDSGRAKPVAFLQEQGEYFRRGVERMNQYRFARLSVAHWGLSSRERNIYNQFSKQREACLAFGAGSGGMLDGYFYYHKQQPSSYMEGIHGDDASMLETVSMVVAPPARREVMQVVLGQMERCFLDVDALVEAVDEETAVRCLTLVRNWQKAGLLALYEGVADLTTAGQFWQVNLTQGLLTILCADRPPLAGAA
jgi:oxygen-independent coproporphyrinogen-3 oxidase